MYTYGVYSALEPRSNIVDTSDNSPIPSVKIGDFLESLCPIVERDLSSEGFDDYDEYSYSSFGAALDLASDIKISKLFRYDMITCFACSCKPPGSVIEKHIIAIL